MLVMEDNDLVTGKKMTRRPEGQSEKGSWWVMKQGNLTSDDAVNWQV